MLKRYRRRGTASFLESEEWTGNFLMHEKRVPRTELLELRGFSFGVWPHSFAPGIVGLILIFNLSIAISRCIRPKKFTVVPGWVECVDCLLQLSGVGLCFLLIHDHHLRDSLSRRQTKYTETFGDCVT